MKRCLVLAAVLTLLPCWNLFAEEFPYIYKGARPMGMGGAFVALSNDENALFYNPAGLADIKESRVSVVGLEIEYGKGAYKYYRDALDVDLDNPKEVGDFLGRHIGDYDHVAAAFFPNYTAPNFAFGFIGSAKSNFQARDRQYPKLAIDVIGDTGVCAGFAQSFLDDTLLVGSGLKYIYRKSLENEYSIADITTHGFKDRLDDDSRHGSSVLLDLGIIYKLQGAAEDASQGPIQLGMSINNLIGNKLGDAEDLDAHCDLGISKRTGELTLAADYVDIFGQMGETTDVPKRIHLGVEYAYAKFLKMRAGIYQGYLTLGLGLDTRHVQFDILTYAEEVGTYSGQERDRRYMFRLGAGF